MDDQIGAQKEKTGIVKKGLFSHKKSSDKASEVEQEILSMVNEGHESGALETSEAKMINRIFEFVDKEAGDICTKRNKVQGISTDMKFNDALNFMLNSSYSRYPVYEGNIDEIIGFIYLKDACRINAKSNVSQMQVGEIKELFRNAMFIPETMNINDLFQTMQSKKNQIAIVVDEYGQTAGVVSMEDILEEIVGNIMDEYDVEKKHIRKRGNEFIIDGFTPLSEIEEELKITFEESDFETLNGYMISKLDRLPLPDEKFETQVCGYSFEILKVDNRMISKVSAKKIITKDEE